MISVPRGSYTPTFERRPAPAPPSPTAVVDHTPRTRRWRPGLGLGTLAIALLVALPLAFTAWRTGLWTSVGSATPMVTIAVLPFDEYASDVADALLAAQLTDGVTGELARLRTLGVVSHTSARQFADTRRPLREIAQALNAEMILEGSVTTAGDAVRVSARLVDARIDRKVWVSDFTGTRRDLLDLERRIAAAAGSAAVQSRNR